jgi:hypothetical protein
MDEPPTGTKEGQEIAFWAEALEQEAMKKADILVEMMAELDDPQKIIACLPVDDITCYPSGTLTQPPCLAFFAPPMPGKGTIYWIRHNNRYCLFKRLPSGKIDDWFATPAIQLPNYKDSLIASCGLLIFEDELYPPTANLERTLLLSNHPVFGPILRASLAGRNTIREHVVRLNGTYLDTRAVCNQDRDKLCDQIN